MCARSSLVSSVKHGAQLGEPGEPHVRSGNGVSEKPCVRRAVHLRSFDVDGGLVCQLDVADGQRDLPVRRYGGDQSAGPRLRAAERGPRSAPADRAVAFARRRCSVQVVSPLLPRDSEPVAEARVSFLGAKPRRGARMRVLPRREAMGFQRVDGEADRREDRRSEVPCQVLVHRLPLRGPNEGGFSGQESVGHPPSFG